jgi:hypothetical protein
VRRAHRFTGQCRACGFLHSGTPSPSPLAGEGDEPPKQGEAASRVRGGREERSLASTVRPRRRAQGSLRYWVPPKRSPAEAGLSVIQSVGAKVSAPTTIPCHTVCGLQTPVISVGKRSRKPSTAKFKSGSKGLNPAGTGSANQNDSGFLKDLAQGRRLTRYCEPAGRSPRRAEVAGRTLYPVVKPPLSLARARTTDGPG